MWFSFLCIFMVSKTVKPKSGSLQLLSQIGQCYPEGFGLAGRNSLLTLPFTAEGAEAPFKVLDSGNILGFYRWGRGSLGSQGCRPLGRCGTRVLNSALQCTKPTPAVTNHPQDMAIRPRHGSPPCHGSNFTSGLSGMHGNGNKQSHYFTFCWLFKRLDKGWGRGSLTGNARVISGLGLYLSNVIPIVFVNSIWLNQSPFQLD